MRDAGAQVLDSREPPAFASAHLWGSLNVGLSGNFATWAGTLLDRNRAIVVIADPGREREMLMRLGRIGFDQVVGYLDGGIVALRDRPELIASMHRVSVDELLDRLASSMPSAIVDVRTQAERETGFVEGSIHVPLHQLLRRRDDLPRGIDLVMVCARGYRSCIAASILECDGFPGVGDLEGGMAAWTRRRA
jgi:hydroxyacylglutathione hydrolase